MGFKDLLDSSRYIVMHDKSKAVHKCAPTDPKTTLDTTRLKVSYICNISIPESQISLHFTFMANHFQVIGHFGASTPNSGPPPPPTKKKKKH